MRLGMVFEVDEWERGISRENIVKVIEQLRTGIF